MGGGGRVMIILKRNVAVNLSRISHYKIINIYICEEVVDLLVLFTNQLSFINRYFQFVLMKHLK